MKKQYFIIFLLLLSVNLHAQPKHEFRAVWVATVANIDWPSQSGLSVKEQKKEAIAILNQQKELGINTVILQVRPAADAFYLSDLEPWSRYLSGTQGQAPSPFYDPLDFWVKECHERGMELHAWLNPYRVANNADYQLAETHIALKHPEWVLKYGKKLYFDPGIPQTREFIAEVVKDIVSRYDVDAIHLDDYFYPYPLKEEFPDTASFRQYNRGYSIENIADWRRENVDMAIKMMNETIKSVKPWVKFGISPFGVWRNKADDPAGSDTRAGATNYDDLYADVVKWQKEGWIDYLLPQLYWRIGHPAVDFNLLANWWKNHAFNRAMYIGQAPYRISSSSKIKEWTDPGQLPKQIDIIRSIPEIEGSAYFSSKWFNCDLLGFQDSLKVHFYKKPAIIPPMPWIDEEKPQPVVKIKRRGKKIKWQPSETTDNMNMEWQYVVYLTEKGQPADTETAKNIYSITPKKKIKFKKRNKKKKEYDVRVSVLDRCNNESTLSESVEIKL